MHLNYYDLACDCWFLLAAVWLFGLLTAKLEQFGAGYRQYQQRVKALIPHVF